MSNLFYEYNKSQHDVVNSLNKEMHGEGETEFLLIFNKTSGAYIGRTCGHVNETKSDSTHYKFKKVSFLVNKKVIINKIITTDHLCKSIYIK